MTSTSSVNMIRPELNHFLVSATCRRWILCANVPVHSRFGQRKTGPCLSQSLECPYCRYETSGLRRSWWSAPDTERLWSHMHTLSSPGGKGENMTIGHTCRRGRQIVPFVCVYSQQIYCWLFLKSASHLGPWTPLSSSLFSSSPASCRRTSSQ